MEKLKRSLNLFDAVMLVSGSMIGSGIFIVSADMMRILGSPFWVLMCWLISGFITLIAALSYGELSGMMPEGGGQFVFLKRAYGKAVSFVYGWAVFTVIQTGVIAAVAVAFARYIGVFIPFFDEQHILFSIGNFSVSTTQVLAIASVFFLTWINTKGINNGKIIQAVFTSTKIIALLAIIIIGFIFSVTHSNWQQNISLSFNNSLKGGLGNVSLYAAIGVALIGSLFSSDAWNNVTFIAAEIKEPQKNIPLGLLIGVLIVTVLYILANVAYFILLPAVGTENAATVMERGIAYAQNDRVGSAALFPVFGNIASSIMALLIVISTFGCNNGLILSGSRLFYVMANDGLFFKSAAQLNKHQVPSNALWQQATWTSVLCLSGSYGMLLNYCTFASLLFYIVTISSIFYLRKKEPDAHRPYKAFGYPLLPALYILIASAICLNLLINKTQEASIGLFIIGLGIPVYYFFRRNKNA